MQKFDKNITRKITEYTT